MKTFRLILLWLIVTIVTIISWTIGNLVGNALTGSAPPPPPDPAMAGTIFMAVCAFNAILIVWLIRATDSYSGSLRNLVLVLYVFATQSLLPQMETYFFGAGMGISSMDASAIVIAGFIVCVTTVILALFFYRKFRLSRAVQIPLTISFNSNRKLWLTTGALCVFVYPFLYLSFGYFIAWQNENLRFYYTGSREMLPYSQQIVSTFRDGIYIFQVFRAALWLAITAPVAIMLGKNKITQYLSVAVITSLLPSSLLFIPNPFMPADIAMTHFVEVASSNFVWGLVMVWAVRLNTK